jgi:hypothetical protein
MKKIVIVIVHCIIVSCSSFAQTFEAGSIEFKSSDTALQNAFQSAKKMALYYRGKPSDPVGPWYESALPPRYAFCMRDVAHQCLGAEILGLQLENKNMFELFAKNISESKDWCSYWEINKYGKPAPEDYRNDKEFWYNLNANFDIINACWRIYLWTGDKRYINGANFLNFHKRSVDDYIKRWTLQPDSLLKRLPHPNAPVPFNINDAFHRSRGLPSYVESVENLKMGIDLVAALYSGLKTYSFMLTESGNKREAKLYESSAESYRKSIDSFWWDKRDNLYFTYYTNEGKFEKNEGETFLLWFDALKDSVRVRKTIEHLLSRNWNIENLSYFPYLLSKYGYWKEAYNYILLLTDNGTKRREYPEVSFGVLQGIVLGLMGVEADARYNRITTIFRSSSETTAELDKLPVLKTLIKVKHEGTKATQFFNKGKYPVIWRVKFSGDYPYLYDNGKPIVARQERDWEGHIFSFADFTVNPGIKKSISAVNRIK